MHAVRFEEAPRYPAVPNMRVHGIGGCQAGKSIELREREPQRRAQVRYDGVESVPR